MSETKRFVRPGVTKFWFVPGGVADLDGVTTTELATGVDLSCHLTDPKGLNATNSPEETPDFCSNFVGSIPGLNKGAASSIAIYEGQDPDGSLGLNDVLDILAQDADGTMVIFPYGYMGTAPAAGDLYDAVPIRVASNTREYDQSAAAKSMIEMTITAKPSTNKALA